MDPNWPMRFSRGFPYKYRMKHSFVGTYLPGVSGEPGLEMKVLLNDTSAGLILMDTGLFTQGKLPVKPLALDFSLQKEVEINYDANSFVPFSK